MNAKNINVWLFLIISIISTGIFFELFIVGSSTALIGAAVLAPLLGLIAGTFGFIIVTVVSIVKRRLHLEELLNQVFTIVGPIYLIYLFIFLPWVS